MDRLTKLYNAGRYGLVKVKDDEQDVDSPYPNTLRAILESFQALGAYEDTGLAPDEIVAMRDKMRAMETIGAQPVTEIPATGNRVLTLDEVLALPEGARVWVEYNLEEWAIPVCDRVATFEKAVKRFRYEKNLIPGGGLHLGITHYGRWHRVWSLPQEPTQAEKDANPWEAAK